MLDARSYERELRPLLAQAGAYARSLLGSRHDAEDAVQQAALRAWERWDIVGRRPKGARWLVRRRLAKERGRLFLNMLVIVVSKAFLLEALL